MKDLTLKSPDLHKLVLNFATPSHSSKDLSSFLILTYFKKVTFSLVTSFLAPSVHYHSSLRPKRREDRDLFYKKKFPLRNKKIFTP